MSWVKTLNGQYFNLNKFDEFKTYSMEDPKGKHICSKLSIKNENRQEVIGYFSDINEAEGFVKKLIFCNALVLEHFHYSLDHYLINVEEFPKQNEGEDWHDYWERRTEFVDNYELKEEEYYFNE